MTKSIDPIKAKIRKALLTRNELDEDIYLDCKIISIQAYKGLEMSFQVLINDNVLYSNILLKDLLTPNGKSERNELNYNLSTKYIICSEYEIDVYNIEYLSNRKPTIFINEHKIKETTYLTTIDFYTGNEQLHLIKGENRFYLIPNHKILWGDMKSLPDYKKI